MVFMHALDIYAIMHFRKDIYAKTPKKNQQKIAPKKNCQNRFWEETSAAYNFQLERQTQNPFGEIVDLCV